VASIAVFNPAVFYQVLEFTKHNFSLAFFFIAYTALTNREGRFSSPGKISALRLTTGLGCLAVSVLSHRMMLAAAGLFAAQALALRRRATPGHGKGRQSPVGRILLYGGLALAAVFVAGMALLKTGLLDRLGAFSLAALPARLKELGGTRLLPGERIFYLLLQIFPPLLVPAMVIKRRLFGRSETVFGLLAFIFAFPFLEFSWDGIGFRLLLLEPLMLAPLLMAVAEGSPFLRIGNVRRFAAALVIAASAWFALESARHLTTSKGPGYRQLAVEFASIETLVRGRRLVAHRGLAGYLWYEKGIWAENFTPAEERGRYLRVVYALSPEIFEPWLKEGDPRPVRISGRYTLIEEYIWQRFYREKQDLRFLRSELNPYLPRPASAFTLNISLASRMSPVSENRPKKPKE
jgi:hypothetical protein